MHQIGNRPTCDQGAVGAFQSEGGRRCRRAAHHDGDVVRVDGRAGGRSNQRGERRAGEAGGNRRVGEVVLDERVAGQRGAEGRAAAIERTSRLQADGAARGDGLTVAALVFVNLRGVGLSVCP